MSPLTNGASKFQTKLARSLLPLWPNLARSLLPLWPNLAVDHHKIQNPSSVICSISYAVTTTTTSSSVSVKNSYCLYHQHQAMHRMLAAATRRFSFSSSSSQSSSSGSSSTSTKSRRPVLASLLGRGRSATSVSEPINTVPIDTVRKLLMGQLDPVELAKDILPQSDLAGVVRYNSAPYRPPLDLKKHEIATAEDILFVGLTYVGFDGKRQNIRGYMNLERFCSHYKICPEAIFDAWKYFLHNSDETIEFEDLLLSLNFLKCCEWCFRVILAFNHLLTNIFASIR